jgi:methylmalonyl-CoA mutase, N-terminal domain
LKTTKEIILEELSKIEKQPLYNKEILENLQELERVQEPIYKEKEERFKTPKTMMGSNIPRELLYTPLSNPDFDYNDLGNSGQEPYTRGIHPNMYRGREFTTRQLTGFGLPEDTNERMKFMLDHGATGLSILFDLPTIQLYDSDDPYSKGQIGMSGVCVDSVDDMFRLFKDIPLDKTSISIVTHYPTNTLVLFPMFLVIAEEQGVPFEKLRGSVQNDMTMEELVRSGIDFIPPQDCFRIQNDNIEYLSDHVPNWNTITLNGYNLRDFGTNLITESAVAISNGIATLEEMFNRGYDPNYVANRITFFWAISNDFFEEVSRLRAVRRLWYKIMKYRFKITNPKALLMRCHSQTSGISLTQVEPHNNIIRSSFQALSAVLGGVQSLHINSFDEAFAIPTEESALLSLRTQQIIQKETAITDVVDPLGGSFYVESLTDQIEQKILDEIDTIESDGGYVKSIESGKIYNKIVSYFTEQQKNIDSGKIEIVGKNVYKSDISLPPIDVFQHSEEVEKEQKQRLTKLRETRNNDDVQISLQALEYNCKTNKNLFPYSMECARARCTEGEMFKVFKDAFGLWKPPSFI